LVRPSQASASNLNARLEEDGGKLNIGAGFVKPVCESKETTNALGASKLTADEVIGA
jgi:hypothetical protein